MGIDVVGLQFGWQILVVGCEHVDVGSVVIGDDDRIAVNADVSVQSCEEVLSQMGSVPALKRIANSLPELMNPELLTWGCLKMSACFLTRAPASRSAGEVAIPGRWSLFG